MNKQVKYFTPLNVLLCIIIILLIIYLILWFRKKNNMYENFENFNLQSGVSVASSSDEGVVIFKNAFLMMPTVYCQILSSANNKDNAYTVQIYNVTLTQFNYSVSQFENQTIGNNGYKSPSLKINNTITFNWLALV